MRQGHAVRALVRNPAKAGQLPHGAQVVLGDVTRPDTLFSAVEGVDAIVFTLGSDGAGKAGAESVDYGGVRNVLAALGSRTARIALMTSIGVTNRTGSYNQPLRPTTGSGDLKGWFVPADCHTQSCVQAGSTTTVPTSTDLSSCRAIHARPEIPAMASLRDARSPRSWSAASSSDHALRKTFELIATTGPASERLRCAVRSSRCGPARLTGRRARHGKSTAGRRAEAGT